jgi:vacuolar-type H+-ATPase subunit H
MNDQVSNEDRPMNEAVSEAKAGVKETVREAKDKIKEKTKEVATQARERGEEYFRENKERAADRIGSVSESIRQTADRFEQEKDPNIAHYTRLVADKLERAAGYIRERDLNQLKQDGEDLARQHPAVFFGGMFVAGLAAARFLKASAEREHTAESSKNFSGTEEEMEAVPAQAGTGSAQQRTEFTPDL